MEAIQNQKEGREVKPTKPKKVKIPEVILAAFKEDPALEVSFNNLSPGKKREYCEHIDQAKREATKKSRLKKIIPMIKAGQGLHDKYKNC